MTILLVDDNKDLRDCYKEELSRIGFVVFEAEDGEQALGLLRKQVVDLVISDVQMPILDGVGFLKQARKEFKNLPIFIITGFSPYTEKEILNYGANGYFEKPNLDLKNIINQVFPDVA